MTQPALNTKSLDTTIVCGVETVMGDGVVLVSELWGADPQNPKPVVLERTPYGRLNTDQAERAAGHLAPAPRNAVAQSYVEAGFAYCVQDCRGTGDSSGSFDKYVQEGADSTDTIAWIRRQPWCDGSVVMVGFSYGAACQLAAMVTDGDAPDAAVLDCGGFSDALTSGIRQGGALALKQATWSHAQALRDARARGDQNAVDVLLRQDLHTWLLDGPWVEGHTPLAGFCAHQSNLEAMWQQSMDGPYWDRPGLRSPRDRVMRSATRVLFVTSWFDTSLRATLDNYAAMVSPGATCPEPELIIGPWSHGDRWSSVTGDVDLGDQALPETGLGAGFANIRQRFVQKVVANKSASTVPLSGNKHVHYFELGSTDYSPTVQGGAERSLGGQWRHSETWPPEGSSPYRLFLSDQSLSQELRPASNTVFCSDPHDPVPTLGGAINSGGDLMPGGIFDQSALSGRDDCVHFYTPAFADETVFIGPVLADVWASSSAVDYDLAVKLVLILRDGTPFNVSDGICRARHRNGVIEEEFATPGKPARIPVVLNPVALRVAVGERLRLDVAGSNFPCFDINPQTGSEQGHPSPKQPAEISIHCGVNHPSQLQLQALAS